MDQEIALQICQKYRADRIKQFQAKQAETRFLKPIGLNLKMTSVPWIEVNYAIFSHQQEGHYFKAMQFLRFSACRSAKSKSHQKLSRVLNLHKSVRHRIIHANLGLVFRAMRITGIHADPELLVSAGYENIIDAVDSFDPWRGFRFSTYAIRSMLRCFSREIKDKRIPIEDSDPDDHYEIKKDEIDKEVRIEQLKKFMSKRSGILTNEDIDLLAMRFNWGNPSAKPLTYREIGQHRNLSKERIRQIQNDILNKLRDAFIEIES